MNQATVRTAAELIAELQLLNPNEPVVSVMFAADDVRGEMEPYVGDEHVRGDFHAMSDEDVLKTFRDALDTEVDGVLYRSCKMAGEWIGDEIAEKKDDDEDCEDDVEDDTVDPEDEEETETASLATVQAGQPKAEETLKVFNMEHYMHVAAFRLVVAHDEDEARDIMKGLVDSGDIADNEYECADSGDYDKCGEEEYDPDKDYGQELHFAKTEK